jgi:hypothetical protein
MVTVGVIVVDPVLVLVKADVSVAVEVMYLVEVRL